MKKLFTIFFFIPENVFYIFALAPTRTPSQSPHTSPTKQPSLVPTKTPSGTPKNQPSHAPTYSPIPWDPNNCLTFQVGTNCIDESVMDLLIILGNTKFSTLILVSLSLSLSLSP